MNTEEAALGTAASKGQLFNSAVLTGLHHAIVKTHEENTLCVSAYKPPFEFDARVQLSDFLTPIQDQGTCGACWAFASTAVLADRYAWFMDQSNVPLAAEYLLYCGTTQPSAGTDVAMLEGCHGGTVAQAFDFLQVHGTLSLGCSHYTYAQWSEDDKGSKYDCRNLDTCPSSKQYKPYMYRALSAYIVPGTLKQHTYGSEENIRADLFYNGTSCSTFTVYADFITYWSNLVNGLLPASSDKSIYKWDKTSPSTGAHAIRLLGWGIHGKGATAIKYWIVANSWGATNWDPNDYGPNGAFRIVRGVDECGIESNVIAGFPVTQPDRVSPFGRHAYSTGIKVHKNPCTAHVIPLTLELYTSLGYAPLKPFAIKALPLLPPPTGRRPNYPYLEHCPRALPKRCPGSAICAPPWWPCNPIDAPMLVGTGEYGSALVDRELALTKQQRALEQEASQTGDSGPLVIGLSVALGVVGLTVIILVVILVLAKRKPAAITAREL